MDRQLRPQNKTKSHLSVAAETNTLDWRMKELSAGHAEYAAYISQRCPNMFGPSYHYFTYSFT